MEEFIPDILKPTRDYPQLPVKIFPHVNESMFGYVRRLAVANYYPSASWITDLEPMLKRRSAYGCAHQALKRLVGYSKQSSPFYQVISSQFYFLGRLRICPACIEENGYHDTLWDLRFVCACPYHKLLLLDACPCCQLPLDWQRVQIDICSCGADLKKTKREKASNISLYFTELIFRASGRDVIVTELNGIQPELLNYNETERLLRNLVFLYTLSTKSIGKARQIRSVAKIVEMYDVIYALVSEWPLNFYKFLDSFRNNEGLFKGEGLQQAFGLTYRRIYAEMSLHEVQYQVAQAFEAYIHENWPGVVDERYGRVLSKATCNYLPLSKAIRGVHISRNRMNKLIDLKMIPVIRKYRPTGRVYIILKKCEAADLAALSQHMIDKKEVCHMLGVGKAAFDVLVEKKMIIPLIRAGERRFGEWWCDRRMVQFLLDEFMVLMPKTAPENGSISFSRMCQAYLAHRDLLPDLLRSILNGQIRVSGCCFDQSGGVFKLSAMYFDIPEQ